MAQSKKHHIIPQSVLQNFSYQNNKKQIYVYDKKRSNLFLSSIVDAGSENHFNSIKLGDLDLNFESFFDTNDSSLATIIKKIIDKESIAGINTKETKTLIRCIAFQLMRTKIQRTTFVSFHEQLKMRIENEGWLSDIHIPSEQEAKLYNLAQLSNIEKIAKSLDDKIILLYKTHSQRYWITDNPIIVFNSLPYGDNDIESRGIQIYFPISEKFVLCLLCPSHLEEISIKYQSFNSKHIIDTQLITDNHFETQIMESRGISFLKYLQISSSSRFIYSSDNDFLFATEVLKEFPKYREITSQGVVGEVGKGPLPQKNMPKGEYLVVHGNRFNHMIKINVIKGHITAKFIANDSEAMKRVENDKPHRSAEIYSDGRINKQIPNPQFDKFTVDEKIHYELSYKDKSIEALFKEILKEK
ncbi:DUF4238 domain-containing protein [Adhaeribacter radiodurans]|uniref:DUF4238 domain-containing protein n=1 Tax=Adhaeribacter radiodurans TaxID=2745197 RepID=A0A7L7L1D5_9BACT|nr:DUF4238 domain-containing protein [Adhaeribacter radiodurans]QMU26602.1 DUF4238 domain-containing protein [Adhaeribacter radiodurans]